MFHRRKRERGRELANTFSKLPAVGMLNSRDRQAYAKDGIEGGRGGEGQDTCDHGFVQKNAGEVKTPYVL